jgi:hypothetical protein
LVPSPFFLLAPAHFGPACPALRSFPHLRVGAIALPQMVWHERPRQMVEPRKALGPRRCCVTLAGARRRGGRLPGGGPVAIPAPVSAPMAAARRYDPAQQAREYAAAKRAERAAEADLRRRLDAAAAAAIAKARGKAVLKAERAAAARVRRKVYFAAWWRRVGKARRAERRAFRNATQPTVEPFADVETR